MLREFIERKRCFYTLTKDSRGKVSASESIWDNKFFNIPPGEDFAYALVRGLEDRLKAKGNKGPDRFADIVIISNTARSIKRLKSVFFERGIGILPKIGLVTDLSFLVNGLLPVDKKIKVESRIEKILTLEKLIFSYLNELGDKKQKEKSFDLAFSLEEILRELILSGLDVEAFEKIENMDLSSHWIQSLKFLKVIKEYKRNLNKHNILDEENFNLFILKLIEKEWQERTPNYPIILAGSTGSRYPTARLMRAVSLLPKGCIILPGVDNFMPGLVWSEVGPDHPQYSFKMLYSLINGSTADSTNKLKIKNWAADKRTLEIRSRAKFLSYSFLPATKVEMWYNDVHYIKSLIQNGFKDVSILEASSPRIEAEAIALAIRIAIEEKKSVSLVTADNILAKRVTVALKRWKIIPDDSFGEDPLQTPLSRFLRLILDFQCSKFDLANFLSILKHPFCFAVKRKEHLNYLRQLEIKYLRGKFFEIDINEMRKILSDQKNKFSSDIGYIEWLCWLEQIIDIKSGMASLAKNQELSHHLEEFKSLIGALVGLVRDRENKIKNFITRSVEVFLLSIDQNNGSKFQSFLNDIKANSIHARKMNSVSFQELVLHLIKDLHLPFDPVKASEKVYIWGTLESRTQSTDLCILGGLNEGVWPRHVRNDFWLNSKMRADMGLSAYDQTIGLAAHDFQNAFLMKEVLLSRSVFSEGGKKLASRWLLRLDKLFTGIDLEGEKILKEVKQRGSYYLQVLSNMHKTRCNEIRLSTVEKLGLRPCPVPPISSMPKKISVTSFSRLLKDPYEIYARDILKLRRVDQIYIPFDARMKGIFLHEQMQLFIAKTINKMPERASAISYFLDLVLSKVSNSQMNERAEIRLTEELKNKAIDIIEAEIKRRKTSSPISVEKMGQKKFFLTSGFEIELVAKADRIDLSNENKVIILDYKSSVPRKTDFNLNMPQLDLEALIAKYGGFQGVPERTISEVGLIILGPKVDEFRREVNSLHLEGVEKNFIKIIEKIYSGEWGYSSKISGTSPYDGDYDHLARYGEWSISDEPMKQNLKERE